MPEDVGGPPFPDGGEPDESQHHGSADEEFASVVFDEDFVRSAPVHEPTAVERLLAAAEARAEASEAEARRSRTRRHRSDDDFHDGLDPDDHRGRHAQEFDDDLYDPDLLEDDDGYGHRLRYGAPARWHRPVAWLLAVVMGLGMVALAFTAVYRGASSGRQERVPPPASTELDKQPPSRPESDSGASAGGSGHPSGGTSPDGAPGARTRASARTGTDTEQGAAAPLARPRVSATPHGR